MMTGQAVPLQLPGGRLPAGNQDHRQQGQKSVTRDVLFTVQAAS